MRLLAVVRGVFTLSVGCSDTGGVDNRVIEIVNQPANTTDEQTTEDIADVLWIADGGAIHLTYLV